MAKKLQEESLSKVSGGIGVCKVVQEWYKRNLPQLEERAKQCGAINVFMDFEFEIEGRIAYLDALFGSIQRLKDRIKSMGIDCDDLT